MSALQAVWFGAEQLSLDIALAARYIVPIVWLLALWCWETWRPFMGGPQGRFRHAWRNLSIALMNAAVIGLAFASLTAAVADWTQRHAYGLLHAARLPQPARFALGLVLLDLWMYVWHRANHAIGLLWRFHRMHHSDRRVDVTTATRFHLGEHVGAWALRLGLIPLLGLDVWQLVAYDTLVLAVTQFHHADISIGRLDGWLRCFLVTPYMHKVHHSDWTPETNSNYATVLSVWDRLFGSFRMREDPRTLVFGLREFSAPDWQGVWGMLKTPFATPTSAVEPARRDEAARPNAADAAPPDPQPAGAPHSFPPA